MDNLLLCENLSKSFRQGSTIVSAVDNANLSLEKGQILGIVGESGSGKSTLGKLLVGLLKPDHGKIQIHDRFLGHINRKDLSRMVQMVFQDWQSSLDPLFNIYDILTESWSIHRLFHVAEYQKHLFDLLDLVQLPKDVLLRIPRQLSGGQLQRVVIARALSLNPEILIADEPTSSLDIPLRQQILELFFRLKSTLHIGMIIISHDLDAVTSLADHIFVMFRGKFVEHGTAQDIIKKPHHPYTIKLTHPDRLIFDDEYWEKINDSFHWNNFCPFFSVCDHKKNSCHHEKPFWKNIEGDHWVLCQ